MLRSLAFPPHASQVLHVECRAHCCPVPTDYTKLVFGPHAGPVVALCFSPSLPELLLSVGDWTFRLWHHGLDTQVPLFVSPAADDTYTAGEGGEGPLCVEHLGNTEEWPGSFE